MDVVVVAALVVAGVIARRDGLPFDGLWYDDAWVAAGASKASPSELLTVSTTHPGFTGLLMAWIRLVSDRSELMAWPALLVGIATPPIAYLILVRLGFERVLAIAVSGLVVVAPAHVQYSGRVKSYVLETLAILGLAVLVSWLARRSWSWTTVGLWLLGAVLVGTLSSFTMLATAIAGLTLLAHPTGDRWRRLVAVGLQGVVQAGYFVVVQRSFDSDRLAADWESVYDGYIELDLGPVAILKQVVEHVSRVGDALVAGPPALTIGVVVLATLGLVVASVVGPRAAMSRFLLALLGVGFLGSLARVLPFGASNELLLSPGSRATLWLFPSLLVGSALTADLAMRSLRRRKWPIVPAQLVLLAVVGVLFLRSTNVAVPYPLSGARSAHEYILDNLDPDDPVVMFGSGVFAYAVEPGVPVDAVPAPESPNSFRPKITDPRVWLLGHPSWDGTVASMAAHIGDADRLIVHNGLRGFGDAQLPALEEALSALGFEPTVRRIMGDSVGVDLWEQV